MIDLLTVPREELNQSLFLLQGEFKRRGWQAKLLYEGSSHCFVTRDDGVSFHIFGAAPPTSSYAAAHLVDNKLATYRLLKEADVSQLETILLDAEASRQETEDFLKRVGTAVIKPVDGAHGKGITIGITTYDQARNAAQYAASSGGMRRSVLMQQQYPSEEMHDLRILCIDYKFVAAIERIPARVYGDGYSTIRTLIERENNREVRGEAYKKPLATIDVERAQAYLGAGIEQVPAEGEEVRVIGVSNYGAGGETSDVTDDVPEWLRLQAETVARTCGLPVAGIDFLTAKTVHAEADQEMMCAALIEVNKAPSLAIHDLPSHGTSRGAVKAYVDYLAQI